MPECLTALLHEAHREYKANVPSNMTRRIFVKQFIDGHQYGSGTSMDAMNNHCKALGMVETLLTERADLIGHYFGKSKLTDEDISEMMRLLYTETRIDDDGNPIIHNPLKCTLGDEDWPVIMECVNKNHIFFKDVSAEEIRGLLHCSLNEPLIVKDPKALCYLMDELSKSSFINSQWQTPLADSESIVSKRTGGFITATYISTVISRLKAEKVRPFSADIDLLVEHLKAKTATVQ